MSRSVIITKGGAFDGEVQEGYKDSLEARVLEQAGHDHQRKIGLQFRKGKHQNEEQIYIAIDGICSPIAAHSELCVAQSLPNKVPEAFPPYVVPAAGLSFVPRCLCALRFSFPFLASTSAMDCL